MIQNGFMVTFDDIIWMVDNLSLRKHLNGPSIPSSKFTMERHEVEEYIDIIASRMGSRPTRHAVPYDEIKWFYIDTTGERNINDYSGNSITVSIYSNVDWSISRSGGSWVSASDGTGHGDKAVTFTWQDNPKHLARYATFTFSTEGRSYTLEMIDEIENELSVTSTTEGWTSGTFYVEVRTSMPWSATSNDSWINLDPNQDSGEGIGTFSASVTTNYGATRNGSISVQITGGPTLTFNVKQWSTSEDPAAPTISISPSYKTVEEYSESFSVSVTLQGTSSWSYTVYDSDGGGNWVNASKSGNTLNVSTVRNNGAERYASIVFSVNGGASKTLNITQKAQGTAPTYISIIPESDTHASHSGEDISFEVQTSYYAWTISKPSWVDIIGASGAGNDSSIIARVHANTSTDPREGIIRVTGGIAPYEWDRLDITQEGAPPFNATPTTVSAPGFGGPTLAVNVTADGSWTATSLTSWLTFGGENSVTRSGNGLIGATADPNTSTTYSRRGYFRISNGSTSIQVTVIQDPNPLGGGGPGGLG